MSTAYIETQLPNSSSFDPTSKGPHDFEKFWKTACIPLRNGESIVLTKSSSLGYIWQGRVWKNLICVGFSYFKSDWRMVKEESSWNIVFQNFSKSWGSLLVRNRKEISNILAKWKWNKEINIRIISPAIFSICLDKFIF